MPLSDGYHILFTDPGSGGLCLGSDAPLGYVFRNLYCWGDDQERENRYGLSVACTDQWYGRNSGSTKLLRKIWLIPPETIFERTDSMDHEEEDFDIRMQKHNSREKRCRPNIYASGSDLRYGVRVVASYGEHVVLYSIPPDIFNRTMNNEDADNWAGNSTLATLFRRPSPNPPQTPKPVFISGGYLDTVPGLIDLAVDSGSNMTVYAFSSDGTARVYQLRKHGEKSEVPVIKKGYGVREVLNNAESSGEGRWTAAHKVDGSMEEPPGTLEDYHYRLATWHIRAIKEIIRPWDSIVFQS